MRDDFGDGQRGGIHSGHLVHVGDEFGFAAVAAHYVFGLNEERGGFGFVAIQEVSAGEFEKLRKSFRLLFVVGFENFAGAIETVRAEKRFAEKSQERGVFFIGGNGIEKLDAAFGVTFAQARFGEEQSAGAIVGRELVGAVKIFDGFIEAAGGLGELAGAKIAASGEIAMAEAFGEFAEDHMAAGIFRVEQRDAFIAGERFDIASLLLIELRGRAELFDGFAGTILLLKQGAELHQAVGRLRERAQETGEDGGGLRGVAGFHQAVELRAVILGGERGFAEARVDIGERLD